MGYDKKAVGSYHNKLADIRVRVPKGDNIPDYVSTMKEQAEKLGKSLNQYILDLVENDIRNNPEGLNNKDFSIIRGFRSLKDED